MFQKLWPFNTSSSNTLQGAGSGTRSSIDDHGESTRVKPMHPSFNRGIPLNMKIVIRGDIRTGKTSLFERLQGLPFSNAAEYMTTPQIQVANIPWQYPHTKDIIKVEIWDVVDKGVRSSSLKRQSNGLKLSNNAAMPAQTMEPHPEYALDASTIDVYRNADGAIVMYDGSKPWTFEYAVTALTQVPTTIPVLLLKNFSEEDEITDEQAETRLKELLEKHNNHRSALPCAPANLVRYLETNMKSGLGLKEIHASFGIPFLNTVREMHRRKFDQKTQEIGELLLTLDHKQRQTQLTRSMHQSQLKQKQHQRRVSNTISNNNKDASQPTSPRERGPLPPAIQTKASELDPPRIITSTPNSPARKTRNEVTNVDILSPTPLAAAPPAVLLEFDAGQLEEAFFHNVDGGQDVDLTSTLESSRSSKSETMQQPAPQPNLSKSAIQDLLDKDRVQVLAEIGNPMVAQDEDIGDMDDLLFDNPITSKEHEGEEDEESSMSLNQSYGDQYPRVDDSPMVMSVLQGFSDPSIHPHVPTAPPADVRGFLSDHEDFSISSKPLALSGYGISNEMEHEGNPWGQTSSSLSSSSHHRMSHVIRSSQEDGQIEGDERREDQEARRDSNANYDGYEEIGSRRSSLLLASTAPRHSAASGLVDVDLEDVENPSPVSQEAADTTRSDIDDEEGGEGDSNPGKRTGKKKKKKSGKKKSKKGE